MKCHLKPSRIQVLFNRAMCYTRPKILDDVQRGHNRAGRSLPDKGELFMTEPLYTSDEISSILKKIDVLNTLKDVDTILDRILSESRHLANADAGSIFLVKDDRLVFS